MRVFVTGTRGIPGLQGGVEKHCEELYPRLSRRGASITVFNRQPYFPGNRRPRQWGGIDLVYIGCPQNKHLEAFVHTFLSSLICILKRPEIVHFHNMGPALFTPLLKLFGIRTVFTYHSINYAHKKWNLFARAVLKTGEFLGLHFADRIIIVSRSSRDFLKNKYPQRDIRYIPNGVLPAERIPAGDIVSGYGLKQGKYVLAVSRLTQEKGVLTLLNAFRKIQTPEFQLVIAGDADHDTEYSRQVKEVSSHTPGVILTGFLSGKPLQEIYSNAGLFVLPSFHEGLPIALLEALSYGLSVIASDIPQNRELELAPERYFPPGNTEALSQKMLELFDNGITSSEQEAQKRGIMERFDWESIAQETMSIYLELN